MNIASSAISGSPDPRPETTKPAGTMERWLSPCEVALDVDLSNRRHALENVAASIARLHSLDLEPVLRALWRRELIGSTAIGCGVAIPHARIDGITEPTVLYVRAKTPIEFAAPDGKPVRHVIAIAVPADGDPEAHLELLAAIASMMTERTFRDRLAAADDADVVRTAFTGFGRTAGASAA